MEQPLVSICCITFQHKNYIRETLEGFLSQKTDFPFEILIHDDASTDGTADIIREYEKKYPEIIRAVLQTENQYSKGITNISGAFNFPRARGKYIAMCEGDDYWCDSGKLQKQADYMESHQECTLCFHSAKILTVDGSFADGQMRPYKESQVISAEGIIDKPSGYAMASMMFPARLVQQLPEYYVNCPVGDIPLQWMAAAEGNGYYMDEAMSVYRVGDGGSWTAMEKQGDYIKKQQRYFEKMKGCYEAFDRETGNRFHDTIAHAIKRLYFQTQVNTRQYQVVLSPEYREFYRELTGRTRFFIRLEAYFPGLYRALQKLAGRGR